MSRDFYFECFASLLKVEEVGVASREGERYKRGGGERKGGREREEEKKREIGERCTELTVKR